VCIIHTIGETRETADDMGTKHHAAPCSFAQSYHLSLAHSARKRKRKLLVNTTRFKDGV